jgi:hypothetical protein
LTNFYCTGNDLPIIAKVFTSQNDISLVASVSIPIREIQGREGLLLSKHSDSVKVTVRKKEHFFLNRLKHTFQGKETTVFLDAILAVDESNLTLSSCDLVQIKKTNQGQNTGIYQVLCFLLLGSSTATVIVAKEGLASKLLESV